MEKIRDIKQIVLEKIQKGEVPMKARWHFTLRVALVVFLGLIILALSALALSFTFFSIHESGEQFLLGFGQRGFTAFFALFPWKTLIATVILAGSAEWLTRYFKFGYRIPVLRAFFGLLIAIVLVGSLIAYTPIHRTLLGRADHDGLGFLNQIYKEIHAPHEDQGIFRGRVVSVDQDQFMISHDDFDRDSDDGTRLVLPPTGYDLSLLTVGDRVYIAGTIQREVIHAYGIKVLP